MIGRWLCRLGLHAWTPPRGDGYARSVCKRCDEPFAKSDPTRCPSCPHQREEHGPLGCRALFCGCERTWIGAGWP